MASLFVVRGRNQGTYFPLQSAVERIGRDGSSTIQLLDSEVSRHHAEIRCPADSQAHQLIDLGSSNGTNVNGRRVNSHTLQSGDRIEIGGTLMIFTGTGLPAMLDVPHGVDIVPQNLDGDASQIVSSLSQASSQPATSSSEAERSLEVMYLTAIAVGRGEDISTILDRILQLVFDWVDADRGCVMLKDPDTKQLQPAARCDRDSDRLSSSMPVPETTDGSQTVRYLSPQHRISISHTILDYVINKKEGVRTSDAKGDDRFDAAASIVKAGVREALCVPLQGRYDIVGALYIDTYSSPGQLMRSGGQQRFTDDHLRLITAIGHQAALAIEDTFYYSALVQSERLAAMGQTIATLSHHVKNILQGIRGGSYLIDTGLKRDDNDAVRRGWSIVERNQERISNLVLDMLSFSKDREPEKTEGDLNETVRDVVELMKTHAQSQGVMLGSDLDPSLPLAEFDSEAMHRAVLNLVTNAIDAAKSASDARLESEEGSDTPPNDQAVPGHMDLETESARGEDARDSLAGATPTSSENDDRNDTNEWKARVFVQTAFDSNDGWVIDVIDNGAGVPADQREKIFSLFESNKGASGTGLGLPVSAKIMREHGGQIEVSDSGVGSGSRFRLRLPADSTRASEIERRDTMG